MAMRHSLFLCRRLRSHRIRYPLAQNYKKSPFGSRILGLYGSRQLVVSTDPKASPSQSKVEYSNSTPSNQGQESIVPGLVASFAVMQCGFLGAEYLGSVLLQLQGLPLTGSSPVSGVPIAILLGASLRNLTPIPVRVLEPGLKFATTTVLRTGIVCVGVKLSAYEMAALGIAGVPAVMASVGVGLGFILWAGKRAGLPAKMSSLIAAGTSICGVTAITALAPAIGANQREISYAVANVVAFGTFGMLVYPYLAHALVSYSEQAGILLGLSIHDTSQVIAAALTYKEVFSDELALKMAAVTKLTRNVFLAAVIPALAYQHAAQKAGNERKRVLDWNILKKCIPLFVLGFIGVACIRSVGDGMLEGDGKALGLFHAEEWSKYTKLIGNTLGGRYLLGTAMAGVGLSTSAAVLREGGLGMRPFIVGCSGALVVGGTALVSVTVMERMGFFKSAMELQA
ncbi:hypothetical protein AAMO2058_000389500 [Amorphochlora amoebiformis]